MTAGGTMPRGILENAVGYTKTSTPPSTATAIGLFRDGPCIFGAGIPLFWSQRILPGNAPPGQIPERRRIPLILRQGPLPLGRESHSSARGRNPF